jgi:pyruvate dehydrogenase E2 component (dihydrolipoamide acetyltransferase)
VIERDIRTLIGSGAAMKVSEAEITRAPTQAAAPAVKIAAPDSIGYTDVRFSNIRRSIAKAMQSSLSGMAQLTHHHTFDASEIMAYRRRVKASEGALSGISITDMILYVVSRTLINHPDLNAHMVEEDVIRRFDHVHLGLAVDTPRGLMVPTIFNADMKSLLEISVEAKELAAQARSGAINPDLLKGGTFTVSNLGMLGVEMFTPVINPPQTGILGVCSTTTRIRETDGKISTYAAMGLSLTYDHRAVDGAPAARFMAELIKNLENFTVLLAV